MIEMIKLQVPEEIIEEAKQFQEKMLKNPPKGSIRNGEGSAISYVAKKMVGKYLNLPVNVDPGHHTLMYGGHWGDVKGAGTSVPPKPNYGVNVEESNLLAHQCDWYIFCRVLYSLKTVWIVGCYPRDRFQTDAKELKKGVDEGDNGFKASAGCSNMHISNLLPLEAMLK